MTWPDQPARPAADRVAGTSTEPTVEERRLAESGSVGGPPLGPELVRQAGFAPFVDRFAAALSAQPDPAAARRMVLDYGTRLWHAAVDRAHSRPNPDVESGTDLDADAADPLDDRPLYWARLLLSAAVRSWQPPLPLSGADRADLLRTLDHATRGLAESPESLSGNGSDPDRWIMVSGMDPFRLDDGNLNRSNPSAAAALRLHGHTVATPNGPVRVRAVVLPVSWTEFDGGIVEAAYGPALSGPHPVRMAITISQGYPGRFTVERWAANWRGGGVDNARVHRSGPVPATADCPGVDAAFHQTTLPHQAMSSAPTGEFPVEYHEVYGVWPDPAGPGDGDRADHADGEPGPDASAASGSGGDYLSNESMYRVLRLRAGLGLDGLPAGHLHTPVLLNPPGEVTTAEFAAARRAIVEQTVRIVEAAVRTLG